MSYSVQEPPASAGGCGPCGDIVQDETRMTAQQQWAAEPLRVRLQVIQRARHLMAAKAMAFTEAILARSKADTLVSEVIPLLEACRFLERNAERILKPQVLGRKGRPMWLAGVRAEIHREALGHVLVIGPANFPLFLAGVQVMQALVAGNSVTWKPGAGGGAVAAMVAQALEDAGLREGLLKVTADTVQAAHEALAAGPDKVIFTGSTTSGTAVLTELAQSATPAVVELSGVDALIVFPSADLNAVAEGVAFGLRLNGGQVCMSPRRLFANPETMAALRPLLMRQLEPIAPVVMDEWTGASLGKSLSAAVKDGATLLGSFEPTAQRPILVERATSAMAITQSDILAPVISLIEVPTLLHLKQAYERCEYGLTAAIFCGVNDMEKARTLAGTLRAGTVLINDLIVPTADPRVPFGGRGASGYGVTRGTEGLLEMTAVKTLLVRRAGIPRYFAATTDADTPMFEALIQATHGDGWRARWSGLRRLIAFGRSRSK